MELGPQFVGHGLPTGYTMTDRPYINGLHSVVVHHPSDHYPVAHLHFAHYGPDLLYNEHGQRVPGNTHKNDGVVAELYVDEAHRRKGIATAMYQRAKQINPNVHHNREQTKAGRAWAQAVGS